MDSPWIIDEKLWLIWAIICLKTLFLPFQTDAHDRFRFLQYPSLYPEDLTFQPALFSAEDGVEAARRGVASHLSAQTTRQGVIARKCADGDDKNRFWRCGALRP